MHLPYELAELILCQVASVGDAFHLARSSYSFWEVWNNPVSRHRICYEIVLKNLPCLIQFEQLAEAQLASCYRFHNELQSITERASLIGRNADSAKKAMESFELHALRRISRAATTAAASTHATEPGRLSESERIRFLSTYLHQWTLASLHTSARPYYIRALPEDELMRMEDLIYWLSSLSSSARRELGHDVDAWNAAYEALQARQKTATARFAAMTSHWIFLQSQSRQVAAYTALITEQYDISSGERRSVNLSPRGIAA